MMMRPQRFPRHPEAFSRDPSSGRKRPRELAAEHLAFVRLLPCIDCGGRRNIQAAHLRGGSPRIGKRSTGKGEKPSDRYCVPVCSYDHVSGPDAQHNGAESAYWERLRIDPFAVATALWACTGDIEAGELVIAEARARGARKPRQR